MNTTIDIDSTEEINRQGFTLKKQHIQETLSVLNVS